MKRVKEIKAERQECANLFVNTDGMLCELEKRGNMTVNKLFNCVRWDYDGSMRFAFNPEFITSVGW